MRKKRAATKARGYGDFWNCAHRMAWRFASSRQARTPIAPAPEQGSCDKTAALPKSAGPRVMLVSMSDPALNGRCGTVITASVPAERVAVQLDAVADLPARVVSVPVARTRTLSKPFEDAPAAAPVGTSVHAGRLCVLCGATATDQCSRCLTPRYCSKACQKAHWRDVHKFVCTASCELAEKMLLPAVAAGCLVRVRAALDAGATPNYISSRDLSHLESPCPKGRSSALGLAAVLDRDEIIDLLLQRGADPDATQHESGSALMLTVKFDARRAATALLRAGAAVDARSGCKHWTSLHHACIHGNAQFAKLLLDHQADPNAISSEGDSPLFVCARSLSMLLPTTLTVAKHLARNGRSETPAHKGGPHTPEGYCRVLTLLQAAGASCICGGDAVDLESLGGVGLGTAFLAPLLFSS